MSRYLSSKILDNEIDGGGVVTSERYDNVCVFHGRLDVVIVRLFNKSIVLA